MSLQLPQDRLDVIVARHAAATDEINHATEAARTVELAKELAELEASHPEEEQLLEDLPRQGLWVDVEV